MLPHSIDRIKNIIGKRWLLHPENKVQRLRPFNWQPAKPKPVQTMVSRIEPFNKTPEQLRAALGEG